jgi:GNAT superfamily N-acetyltransferase
MTEYRIERLDRHDRSRFACGSPELDHYLRERATQDVRRRVASCFVVVDDKEEVAGFYTLAATSLPVDQLSAERARRLPRYPVVPAVLLGRLAVSLAHRGVGLGAALVADAIQRATRSEAMAYAMIVDAKDDAAARFYAHLAFQPTRSDPRRLLRTL